MKVFRYHDSEYTAYYSSDDDRYADGTSDVPDYVWEKFKKATAEYNQAKDVLAAYYEKGKVK